jgi:Glycine-zipper domain
MQLNTRIKALGLLATAVLTGCASFPRGPSVMSMPGTGMSFEQFRADDWSCQSYASGTVGEPGAQQAAANSGANSAAVGTAVGAAAGALLGAASGNPAAGAAIGAGGGLIVGSAAGTDAYIAGGVTTQDRYDNAYVQCMYAKGHQVPVSPSVAANLQSASPTYGPPSSPNSYGAYPPPGTPPPPGYR